MSMMLNFMMNPVYTGILDSQLANFNQYTRGWARVNGEAVGMRSIPDKRKMDYGYRDVMSMFISMYGVEMSYRIVDQYYFAKNLVRILDLDKMSKRYAPNLLSDLVTSDKTLKGLYEKHGGNISGNIHLPDHLHQYVTEQMKHNGGAKLNYTKLPHQLHELMLGSFVDTGSYDCIPANLNHLADTMHAAGKHPDKVSQVRLLAHHFQRVFLPEEYLSDFLGKQCKPEERALLREGMADLEALKRGMKWTQESTRASEAYDRIQHIVKHQAQTSLPPDETLSGTFDAWRKFTNGAKHEQPLDYLQVKYTPGHLLRATKPLTALSKEDFKLVYEGVQLNHVGTLFNLIKDKGLGKGWSHFHELRRLSQSPLVEDLRFHPQALSYVHQMVRSFKEDPLLQKSERLRKFAELSPTELRAALKEQGFGDLIKNTLKNGWSKAFESYKHSKDYSEARLMEMLRSDVVMPKFAQKLESTKGVEAVKLYEMLNDLTHKMVTAKRMRGLFEGGKFWLKLPLSMVFYFITTGTLSNILDNKYVQPYQRDIVKAGVNPREYMKPLFWSLFPAIGAFVGLMRTGWVRKMGYLGSFAFAGGVSLLGYMGLTFGWFRSIVKSELGKVRRGEKPAFVPDADISKGGKKAVASAPKVAAPVDRPPIQAMTPTGFVPNQAAAPWMTRPVLPTQPWALPVAPRPLVVPTAPSAPQSFVL